MALVQPYNPMNNWLAGTNENMPMDPPAETTPKAMLLFSAGTNRPTALNTTVNVVPLIPRPTNAPRLRYSPVADEV